MVFTEKPRNLASAASALPPGGRMEEKHMHFGSFKWQAGWPFLNGEQYVDSLMAMLIALTPAKNKTKNKTQNKSGNH